MKLDFAQQTVRIANKTYNILVTDFHQQQLYVFDLDNGNIQIFGDAFSLLKLGAIFALSSEIKDTIIYLKTRKQPLTHPFCTWFQDTHHEQGNDIVLFHHTIQFKVHEWINLRNKLSKGTPASFHIDTRNFLDLDVERTFQLLGYKENKDILGMKKQFETIFLISSSTVFIALSNQALDFAENIPSEFEDPGNAIGWHRHLDGFGHQRNLKKGLNLTLNFYDEELWNRGLSKFNK